MNEKFKTWLANIWNQFIGIDDDPFRKAAGLGLGVFLGILPGAGPIAALITSSLLRVNRAAALAGSLLTNSWLSVATFFLALKTGAFVTGVRWQDIYQDCQKLLNNFSWKFFFETSFTSLLKPLLIGYLLVGLTIGLLIGMIAFLILMKIKTVKEQQ